MPPYQDLRKFYNQSLYPELLHLEQRRRRLLRLMLFSVFLIAAVVLLQIYLNELFFTLLLILPVGVWIAYVAFRIRVFYQEFKPRIINLLLDFIDNDVNFRFAGYFPKGKIPFINFLQSRIFFAADEYHAEDLIRGQVRETPFELCELRVREFSAVRSRLDRVFVGVLLVGDFRRIDMEGMILALPDRYRKYLVRSEKAFHRIGGRRVRNNLLPEFEAMFDTFATPNVRIGDVLSQDFQRSILNFLSAFQQQNRQKDIYFSIIKDKIYLALTQDKNLLEPSLFSTNVSYEMVKEFYDDLMLLLNLVLAVDVMN